MSGQMKSHLKYCSCDVVVVVVDVVEEDDVAEHFNQVKGHPKRGDPE